MSWLALASNTIKQNETLDVLLTEYPTQVLKYFEEREKVQPFPSGKVWGKTKQRNASYK